MQIDHAAFLLTLPDDWVQAEGDEQLCFEWAARKASLVIAVLPATLRGDQLKSAGRAMLEARRHAEEELTPGVKFIDVRAVGGDQVAHVIGGSENPATGLVSRSAAVVTKNKIVSVWLGCESDADALIDSVLEVLRVKVP